MKEKVKIDFPDLNGKISKHYGGYMPEGYWHVVLNVEETNPDKVYKFDTTVWDLCILGPENTCKKASPKNAPGIGAWFYNDTTFTQYKMQVASFTSETSAKVFRSILEAKQGDYKADISIVPELDFVNKVDEQLEDKTKILGQHLDYCWFDDIVKDWNTSQSDHQRQAQSLADKNSAKITKLEAELKEARELQKFLKKSRCQ